MEARLSELFCLFCQGIDSLIRLKGMARGAKKVVLMLSYPSDEVGNELVSQDKLDAAGVNPYSDVLDLERYRELFGENKHRFTGVDYVQYYSDLIRNEGAEVEVIFANHPQEILKYTKKVINCDIHSRERTKRLLKENGAEIVCGMDDLLNTPVNGSGGMKNTGFSDPINPPRNLLSYSRGQKNAVS